MNCTQAQDQLLAAEDLAGAALSTELAGHLQTCARCQQMLARLRKLEAAARALSLLDAGDSRTAFLRLLANSDPSQAQAPTKKGTHTFNKYVRPLFSRAEPGGYSIARFRAMAVAAVLLLAIGAAVWLLVADGAGRAQAADATVDRLLEWNIDLAEAANPDERSKIFAGQADTLKIALSRNPPPADQRDLADKLVQNASWLSSNADPLAGAERFDEVADLVLTKLAAATKANQPKAIARLSRQYSHVMNKGLDAQLKRAQFMPLDKPERKHRYERLMQRNAELNRRMQELQERYPTATPKELRKQLKATDLDRPQTPETQTSR